MILLLVNAFRSVPLERLDRVSLGALAICGTALVIVYARLVAALVSLRRPRGRRLPTADVRPS